MVKDVKTIPYDEAMALIERFLVRTGIRQYCEEVCGGDCCTVRECKAPCFSGDHPRKIACSVYLCWRLRLQLFLGSGWEQLHPRHQVHHTHAHDCKCDHNWCTGNRAYDELDIIVKRTLRNAHTDAGMEDYYISEYFSKYPPYIYRTGFPVAAIKRLLRALRKCIILTKEELLKQPSPKTQTKY